MAQTFKFLDMVQARAPENTTYNALLQLGNTLGEAATNIRQRNRLMEIANAMRNGGLSGGADAAYRVGELDRGINLQDKARTYSIQDEDRETKAQDRERERLASENLAGIVPQSARGAAPYLSPQHLIALYGQARQDSHQRELLGLKRQELGMKYAQGQQQPTVLDAYEIGPDGNMQPRQGFQQAAYTPGQMRPGQTPMDMLTQTQGTPVPGVVVDQSQRVNPRHQRMQDDQRIAEEVTAKGGPQKGIPERDIQAYWTNTYGQRPKIGHKYTVDGRQEELAGGTKKIEPATAATIEIALKNLKAIEPVIVKDNTMLGLGLAQATNGWINSEASIALRKGKAAAMQLAYALSGKTVTNKEREDFAALYEAKASDPAVIREAKIRELQKFYISLYDARKKGMSENEAAEIIRKRIALGEPDWFNEDGSKDGKKEGGSPYSGMSDDEIKRKLGIR